MSLGFTLWNMEDGFVDAMVRGWRSTFLTEMEYTNLKEGGRRGGDKGGKEDFEDMRLTLQETDYGSFLANEPALDPKIIGLRATAKWVKEIRYFRATATGPLARFLDFLSYEYMIDNILDLIKAATSSTNAAAAPSAAGGRGGIDMEAVVESCHPLGMLEPSVMRTILAYEDLGEDFQSLYRTVLVDTPVGKYFTQFLQDLADENASGDPDAAKAAFAKIPMTIIENSIKRFYLEDFHAFCKSCGGETAVIMCELLEARADMLTINIAYNSLSQPDLGRGTSRASLFPALGRLYPSGSDLLARVEDEDSLRRALARAVPEYVGLWDQAPVDARGVRDISDAFFRRTVSQLELAFEGQFHYGPFYAYVKLKEQEVKNITWIATCLDYAAYSELDRIIPIFPGQKKGNQG